jgi:competence protein ComEC
MRLLGSRLTAAVTLLLAATACTERSAPAQRVGTARALVISRLMPDPTAVSDDRGEWIEIANLGEEPADLRDWQLRSANDVGFIVPRSLVVPAHGSVVLARNPDSATNGGVRAQLGYSGITLGNNGDWLALRDPGGATVDSVAWSRPPAGLPIEHHAAPGGPPAPSVAVGPSPAATADSAATPTVRTSQDSSGRRELVVRVLDIGQGDAILIQNGGSNVVIDGGPDPHVFGQRLDEIGLGRDTIDAVILTHQHADHYQGLRELFATRRHLVVRFFWENQDPSPNVTLAKLRDSIAARVRAGTLVYRDTDDPCANGTPVCTVTLRGGAKLHIMRPKPDGHGPNNRSPAIKLVGPDSASFTMWMAGDAEHEAVDWFEQTGYARNPGMRVDVLKADHHGSCNGVTDRYVDLLHPSLLVVSLGAVNDYGHMHAQAKALYQRHQIPWYRTDQNGTITLRSSGVAGMTFTTSVERGAQNASGPSDRRSTQPACAGM